MIRPEWRVLPEQAIRNSLNLLRPASTVNLVSCRAPAAFGVEAVPSLATVAAAMCNVGPALVGIGPAGNPDPAVLIL